MPLLPNICEKLSGLKSRLLLTHTDVVCGEGNEGLVQRVYKNIFSQISRLQFIVFMSLSYQLGCKL